MDTHAGTTSLDPRRYLDRINVTTPVDINVHQPTRKLLYALHEAHMLAVPFENLSIHYGQPIVLREALLYDKIVHRRRGGFCYELNGLFAWLLRQLGFDVTLLSAEVAESGGLFSAPYDHLTLLIHQVDGDDWLADVGFGDSFRQPLRMAENVEQDGGDGRTYRILAPQGHADTSADVDQPSYWIVEQRSDTQWEAVYRYTLQPHALADFTERCMYQQTSPESHFTQKRICSLALPNGRISLSDLRLITTTDGQRKRQDLPSEDAYRTVLSERFGVVL